MPKADDRGLLLEGLLREVNISGLSYFYQPKGYTLFDLIML